ncbi:MAG: SUMF1/EgtB/PvdO family nonheme iron enzyme [Opitutaceae bacterium]|nr:SUMF1/EgtB/PvdO family nonheme iron enzyme [Opitutaceae bacterium]MBP9912063.1 SUMF1/EgtB/PvdO family nonheme iron enzyme [Opitutaceae bacterium]
MGIGPGYSIATAWIPGFISGMNCSRFLLSGLIAFTVGELRAATPEVTNIRASQRAGTKLIDILYDLADSDSATVFVSVQLFDNTTSLPSFAVTGDVGAGVTPGANKQIVWNAGQDWNRRYTVKGVARIIADDLSPTPPSAALTYVPAGFGKPEGASNEVFTSGFFMDKTEVSQGQWSTVYNWAMANGYAFDNLGVATNSTHPITGINWYDAVKWCNARSEMEGLNPVYFTDNTRSTVYRTGQVVLNNDFVAWTSNGYRLPTRAEWIKAYWGGNTSGFFPWPSYGGSADDHINGGMANYRQSGDPFESSGNSYIATTPVGYYNGSQSPAGPDNKNGYGLYDMVGNAGEWCWDRTLSGWYSLVEAKDDNSKGPSTGVGTTRCFSGEESSNSSTAHSQSYVSASDAYYNPSHAYTGSGWYTAVGLRTVRGL